MQELYCVCQGLQHNTSLVYLNLSCTRITDKGAEYIAQALVVKFVGVRVLYKLLIFLIIKFQTEALLVLPSPRQTSE